MSVFDHIEFDEHEHVAFCHDKGTGLKAIIAVHNSHLGPALGGCRMWPYANSDEALNDVLRLSKGMTYKAAMANLNQGGGKAVIIGDPRVHKTPEMMLAMGRFVESLSGKYISAEDSGMSVADLRTMAQETTYISGTKANYHFAGEEADGNPAPSTAYGVFTGVKASVEHYFGTGLQGKKVAIQGLGHVGYRLAEHLHREGAELFVADIYPEGINRAKEKLNAKVVSPDEILKLDVDVVAPCAMGATINRQSISTLKAKVIAGAANNQLETEDLGEILKGEGILYAPDYVINAGGIIDIYHQKMLSSNEALKSHLEKIGATLKEVYKRADGQNLATNRVANTIAEEKFKK
ncbi:MAG: amino acid dehydrogenase [Alteromonadaceae bacterium]|uniref:Glu/Leu/Phe/Val dehydrogenase dimerization domain-containing protein n=1 Tax=Paraglaciecola chathamensis TaxID=368405 RepID=UPI000C633C55|nr:Glu/Leu/Phe/Val dehydrogenase dimerization domain-containing protein [Paraglaciecola agarilytica]MBN27930.1 amino acid dehydrogenase [Alteromonadaceae bacterium]|tara:strand:+ start:71637 stop:72686 length:1050 start_codon:yes stop_codon:yes gene_type:complete